MSLASELSLLDAFPSSAQLGNPF